MLNYHKKTKVISLSICAAVVLSACATSGDGSEDIDDSYISSQQGPELQLPPGTTEIEVRDGYRVPEGTVITRREAEGKAMSLEPPQLLLITGDGVWVDTERTEPTVWVRSDAQQLMTYIDRFMDSQKLSYNQSGQNTIRTDWITDSDGTDLAERLGSYYVEGQRHKFELAIVDQKSNEVALQANHLASQQYREGQWIDISTSQRVAKQFLNYFIGYYDSERTREARKRILQQAKVDFELGYDDQGALALVTEREFLAVWEQMTRVLTALNLSITDRDRSEKVYYFNVKEPDSGFWSIFFDDDEAAKVALEPGDYQVRLSELYAGGVSLTFYDAEGEKLDDSTITRIYPEFVAEFKRGKE
ncbi:outer membrane protein assembly factor BamC [Kangiella sediminilitoris]|uniref:Outer membrane protein assembly factor BamC n=1 Tax=Kangiella sediminilitoris TaxID=1144748 RepID=A0A1B3BBA3_9GAMM|nr:outer membrane protein assembly factor BamC [Kangiella sediminilitoris]AOE50065.1 Outer membrane protein assembly factor BamC [Kangiella sediminilitoris]